MISHVLFSVAVAKASSNRLLHRLPPPSALLSYLYLCILLFNYGVRKSMGLAVGYLYFSIFRLDDTRVLSCLSYQR
jgi:hypothetical protein